MARKKKEATPTADAGAQPQDGATEGEVGTTERLFGEDFLQEETQNTDKPPKKEEAPTEPEPEPKEPEKPPAEPEKEEQSAEPPVAEPPAEDLKYLDLSKYGDFKIVQTINGEKREITLKDLNRIDQTDQALTKRGQKLGEERRALAEEKRQLEEKRLLLEQNTSRRMEPVSNEDSVVSNDPIVRRIEEENRKLRNSLNSIQERIQPISVEHGRSKVAQELKAEGFEDGDQFANKIDAYLGSIDDSDLLHAEVGRANTPQGAKDIFRMLKLKELMASKNVTPPPTPSPKPPLERPRPPVVKIEGGGQASNGINDDYMTKYRGLMKRVQQGDESAIAELLSLKYDR